MRTKGLLSTCFSTYRTYNLLNTSRFLIIILYNWEGDQDCHEQLPSSNSPENLPSSIVIAGNSAIDRSRSWITNLLIVSYSLAVFCSTLVVFWRLRKKKMNKRPDRWLSPLSFPLLYKLWKSGILAYFFIRPLIDINCELLWRTT